jgi:hypothetical protein
MSMIDEHVVALGVLVTFDDLFLGDLFKSLFSLNAL